MAIYLSDLDQSADAFISILPSSIAKDKGMQDVAKSLLKMLPATSHAIADILLIDRLTLCENEQERYIPSDNTLTPPFTRLANSAGGLKPLSINEMEHMAWAWHVDRFEEARTYEQKRMMLLKSVLAHRIKGTSGAVKEMVGALFPQFHTTFTEWFQTTGLNPYNFIVEFELNPEQGLNADEIEGLFNVIDEYKNVRSWLQHIITLVPAKADLIVSAQIYEEVSYDFVLNRTFLHVSRALPYFGAFECEIRNFDAYATA